MVNWTTLSSIFLPEASGIPVLMYHEVHASRRDGLTVSVSDFSKQLDWLTSRNYQTITLREFLNFKEGNIPRDRLPERPIVLTFDDGYRGLVEHALPHLQKRHFTACLFVTTSYIQEREQRLDSPYLSLGELQTWIKNGMEVALHSHSHPNYRIASLDEIQRDLLQEESLLQSWEIPYLRALAYPFGARPKDSTHLKLALKTLGMRAAFRIGNRVSSLAPEKDLFEIKRIDIQGTDSQIEFTVKVKKGRSKLF